MLQRWVRWRERTKPQRGRYPNLTRGAAKTEQPANKPLPELRKDVPGLLGALTAIDNNQEFARDWDWYAVDPDGNIGHFTTAGLRPLPESVKQDLEGTEALDEHFQERALPIGSSLVRDGVQARSEDPGFGVRGVSYNRAPAGRRRDKHLNSR